MKTSLKTWLYGFELLTISTLVFLLYISLATQNHFSQLEPMLDGTAPRPYVYRVLTPLVAQAASDLLDISPFASVVFTMYISLLGFAWSILSLTKILLPMPYALPLGLFAPFGLIPFLFEQRHIYDFPTLFLFSLALWLLAKENFGTYLFIFFLATLSKETSFFLILFFLLHFRKIERRYFLSLVFAQLAIYTFVRFTLIMLFSQNPGGLVEFHLHEHMEAYLQNPVKTIILMLTILGIIGISMIDKSEKTRFARDALLAIGAPTLALYFFFGVPFEVRIFLEAYPAMFLMISSGAIHLMGRPKNTDFPIAEN